MFIRDPFSTLTYQQAGNPVMLAGVSSGDSDQVLLQRLHGYALAIYQAQQDIQQAQGRKDAAYAQARLIDLGNLRDLFQTTATQFQGNDADAIGAFGQFMAGVADFINQVKAWIDAGGISSAVAFIPNTILDAIGKIGQKAGMTALGISLPLLALGGLLLFFIVQAEKSPTVRRASAAALL